MSHVGRRHFFFFNDTATTEIYTFPYTTLFRSYTLLVALEEIEAPVEEIVHTLEAVAHAYRPRHRGDRDAELTLDLVHQVEGIESLAVELVDEDDDGRRSEEHTSELQSRQYLVCRLLLEKKNDEVGPARDRRLAV